MEPIVHLFLPVLLVLAIYPKIPKKYVFLLAPLTFLMDFDLFIPEFHRIIFHNIFFMLIIATIVYLLWNKRAFFISLFYLGSHLILDLAYPGSAWFYPIIQKTFYIDFGIFLSDTFHVNAWIGSMPIQKFQALSAAGSSGVFTMLGFILITLVFILVITKKKPL